MAKALVTAARSVAGRDGAGLDDRPPLVWPARADEGFDPPWD